MIGAIYLGIKDVRLAFCGNDARAIVIPCQKVLSTTPTQGCINLEDVLKITTTKHHLQAAKLRIALQQLLPARSQAAEHSRELEEREEQMKW